MGGVSRRPHQRVIITMDTEDIVMWMAFVANNGITCFPRTCGTSCPLDYQPQT